MNSAQNHVSNAEENLLKQLNLSQDDEKINNVEQLPNSANLILNESSNGAPIDNSNNPSETVISLDFNKDVPEKGEGTGDNINVTPDGKSDNILPHTAIMLETDWGSKVYVIGTAHFSEESQEDVARVIQAVHPNFVVLELCQSRSCMLKWEENEILKKAEKMDFKMVTETVQSYGLFQSVMYLLLLSVSAQITRELGMAPGGEFRRAFKEAVNIPGCIVHLGDRPIEITLRRAFASMSWWQTIKFAYCMIFSSKKFDKKDIEKYKNQDYLKEMLGMFGGEFPELKKVFVNERDLYLSYSLLSASMLTMGPEGVLPNTVVGVVGMGHLPGIQRNWQKIDSVELRRVLQIPPPSKTSRFIRFTVKASFIGLTFYCIHKLASKSKFYSSLFNF